MNPFCEISPAAWQIVKQDFAEYLTQYGSRQPNWGLLALLLSFVLYRYLNLQKLNERISRYFDWLALRWKTVLLFILALSLVSSFLIGKIYLASIPHVLDSLAHQFQAKIMSQGKLFIPTYKGPLADALDIEFLQQHEGRLFSRTMPLFPLLLTLALVLKSISFLNPLLNLLSLFIIYTMLERILGRKVALLGVFLGATSPFVIFMGASMMGHPTSLLCSVFVLLGFYLYKDKNLIRGLVILSLGAGLFALERPYSGFIIVLPLSLWTLKNIWLSEIAATERLKRTVILALPLFFCLLFLGWYNQKLTGSVWTLPRMLTSPYDTPGFGPDKGTPGNPNGHNALRGLANISIALAVLSDDLYGWPALCLFPALIGLLAPLNKRKDNQLLNLIRLTIPLFFFAYFIFHGQGLYFGARYYYCLFPHLLVVTLLGLERLAGEEGEKRANLFLIILLLTLMSFATYYPHRLPIFTVYGGIASDAQQLVHSFDEKSVVLLPRGKNLQHLYLSFASFNDPFLRRGPLFMRNSKKLTNEFLQKELPHLPKIIRVRYSQKGLLTNKGAPER